MQKTRVKFILRVGLHLKPSLVCLKVKKILY